MYFLGKLCRRGHDHEESGRSLRFSANKACVACQRLAKEAWKTKDAARYQRTNRAAWLSKYGITIADYDRMLDGQGGMCAICGSTDPVDRSFNVDHDHKTGRVRGLLCRWCNLLLGYAGDDTTRLDSAIEYLERVR